MTLQEKEEEIKKEFILLKDWEEKYEYLIDLGRNLPEKSIDFRSDDKLIYGCQSQVWLGAQLKGVRVFFDADSDALLPRGMAALMIRLYSGQIPFEIISSNANFISEIGLKTFLSPIRSNGLFLFLKKIKLYAICFQEKISIQTSRKVT
ncbi:SufE family protein [Blattabacterium cuenoti]|uniref:SufE family protein n=1 Tax=Blattabacterium cuenoti TaxID=1653831 RepID=UPI00163C8E99|nr:SufE family protein [Blattabacterium cuenoti]